MIWYHIMPLFVPTPIIVWWVNTKNFCWFQTMNFKHIFLSLLCKMKKVNNTQHDSLWETENALDINPINCDSKSLTLIYEATFFSQDLSWNQNDSPKPPFQSCLQVGSQVKHLLDFESTFLMKPMDSLPITL